MTTATATLPVIGKAVIPEASEDTWPTLPIDVDRLVASRMLLQANSGGGKSWALRRLLEQTFGAVAAGEVPAAPQTHEETMAMWRTALKAGCYRMLEAVVDAGPEGIDRQELADVVEMTMTGGTFSTYLGILRRNALVHVQGPRVTSSDVLWPEAV